MAEAKLNVVIDGSGAVKGANQSKRALSDIEKATEGVKKEIDRLSQAQVKSENAINKTMGALKAAAGAWVAYKVVVSTFIKNSIEQQRVETQLAAVLKSTGNAAGVTAKQITTMASEMQSMTAFGDEAVIGMQSLLLTFRNIKSDNFKAATMAILDMSTAMGMDLKGAAMQVGRALNDPIQGITRLQRVGITFSDSQKDVIKNLVETGRASEAQVLILKELEAQFGGSAKAATNTLGGAIQQLKNSFGDLFELNSTDEFDGITAAVKKLTAAMDSQPVKDMVHELGRMTALGITQLANGLGYLAKNIEGVVVALKVLAAIKLSNVALAILGITAGAPAAAVAIPVAAGLAGTGVLLHARSKKISALDKLKQLGSDSRSMSTSYGESYGDMFAGERAALGGVRKPTLPPILSDSVSSGKSSKSKAVKTKTPQELALERVEAEATRNENWFASWGETQNVFIESDAKILESKEKLFEALRWQNQEGLLDDKTYVDELKNKLVELSESAEFTGESLKDYSKYTEPMRSAFSALQSATSNLASGPMEMLRSQYEVGTISAEAYRSGLERIKAEFVDSPMVIKATEVALENLRKNEIDRLPTLSDQVKAASREMEMSLAMIPDKLGDAFVSAIRGAESLGDALKNLLQDIGAVILKSMLMKHIISPIFGGGFADGGVFSGGNLVPFAKGGVVNKPTLFPFAKGVGLMGEAGAEAIMPLKRNSSGQLGVSSEGGGGGTNITMNINAVDSQSFITMLRTNRATVESLVIENIYRNGAVRKAIQQGV